jgi:CubicO group peptidase (beta-lactamase class C family)
MNICQNHILKLTLTVLVTIGFISCNKQVHNPDESIVYGEFGNKIDKKLTPYIENTIKSFDLPGLVIGIVKDQKVVYAKAFGCKNVDTNEPLTIRDLFHMASISKPFVASAIMQLVEQGKINLDSSVVKYIPYFKLEDENYLKITIKQMLNHISGMPDVQDYQWDNPVYSEDALEKYVRSISSEKMHSMPGESFAYSNMAFECLGDVIAKVSEMSFADYQKKNLLDPAGMTESSFLKPEYLPDNWAAPHIRMITTKVWDGYPYNRMHGPSSTLHSNVLEMCNWAITNMNHGIFNERKILEPESYDVLWYPWFEFEKENHIGLSWFINKYKGEKAIGHSGGDIGFTTNLIMLPDKSMAVVVMSNQSPAPVEDVTNAALDIMLDLEPVQVSAPASIPVSQELKENGLDAAVAMWDSLYANHAESYNFDPQHFSGLYAALYMDQVKEAETLTRLCLGIFPEEIINYITEETEAYHQNNPNNMAAQAMLKILQEES